MISKQEVSFPEVAVIHKGTPKKKITKIYDGLKKEIEIMGDDLNQKMRVHFLPGTSDVQEKFSAAQVDSRDRNSPTRATQLVSYPENFVIRQGFEVLRLRAVMPAFHFSSVWSWYSEAYQNGCRIACADREHFIYLKDPVTHEVLVDKGEPYRAFDHTKPIVYEMKGVKKSLEIKSHGRLTLVLEDLVNAGELVRVTLKTQSFYDCLNLDSQLAGIQAVADLANSGNVGGVPFELYRAQQDVAWNHDDGSMSRTSKWFLNVKADPEWVKAAFARMGQNALTGQVLGQALLPANLTGAIDPDAEVLEEEGEFEPILGAETAIENIPLTLPYAQAAELTVLKDGKEQRLDTCNKQYLTWVVEHHTDRALSDAAMTVLEHDFQIPRPDSDPAKAQAAE